jgi:nicotinate-nucleotide adenylyltransferase
VNDLELRRSGPSFTFDTALELKQLGWPTVSWMIGADMLMYLPKWHRSVDLLREVEFVVVRRPGVLIDWSKLPQAFQSLQGNVIDAPLFDISATQIRQRVKAGQSVEGLTPPPVIAYIAAEGLYR